MNPTAPLKAWLTFSFFAMSPLCFAQSSDPLFGERTIAAADDILLVWNDRNAKSFRVQRHNFIGFNLCNPGTDDTELLTTYELNRPSLDQVTLDAFATDLDEDGMDELISVITETADSTSIILMVHHVASGNVEPGPEVIVERLDKTALSEVVLIPVELDGDAAREVLLAYALRDGHINFIFLDGHQSETLTIVGQMEVTTAIRESYGVLFDVLAHDFDQNGLHEILLMGVREDYYDGIHHHSLFAEFYIPDYTRGDTVSLETAAQFSDLLFKESYNEPVINLRLAGGDFNGDHQEEFILAYQLRKSDSDSEYYFIRGTVAGDLRTVALDMSTSQRIHTEADNCCHAISLEAGDLTLDEVDDVLFAAFNEVIVLQLTNDSAFTILNNISTGKGFDQSANRRLSVSVDLDASLSQEQWFPEIAILATAENDVEHFSTLQVYQVLTCMDEVQIMLKSNQSISTPGLTFNQRTPFAMVSGHFDNAGIVLGAPTVHIDRNIEQPLVVINAPPTHFDMFGSEVFDIAGCYRGTGCDFTASYDEGTMEQEQITTSQTQDWGFDATLSRNNEIGGNKMDRSVTGRYGSMFSNVQSKSSTVTVGVNVKALNDDMIFSTISDYETWEYPVYERDSFLGYMSVTIPLLTENRWFPGKSISGQTFLTDHEPGNILSYPEIAEIDDPDFVSELIKGGTNSFTLGPKTDYEWRLEFSDFEENNATDQRNTGIEVGFALQLGAEGDLSGSFMPLGVGVETSVHVRNTVGFSANGKYSNTNFTSHMTSVKNELLLKVNLGDVDGALTGYRVSPFAYWSKSGALVVDYAVEPELTTQGNFESWWSQRYGKKPDPALMLPWKYDPEKGYPIAHELQRTQTKDIVIEPRDAQPGDTVILFTRIHNYSLVPTTDSVRVQWFMGDPDAGGVLITGLDDETAKYSSGIMEPRSSEWVHMLWVLPDFAGRIYAVLDGDQVMEEIHENNNKGWIGMNQTLTALEDELDCGADNMLGQNYPNPFSGQTVIPIHLPSGDDISLELYDMLGRKTGILANAHYPAGRHEISFDGSGLIQGIYFYTLRYGNRIFTRKMVVQE